MNISFPEDKQNDEQFKAVARAFFEDSILCGRRGMKPEQFFALVSERAEGDALNVHGLQEWSPSPEYLESLVRKPNKD